MIHSTKDKRLERPDKRVSLFLNSAHKIRSFVVTSKPLKGVACCCCFFDYMDVCTTKCVLYFLALGTLHHLPGCQKLDKKRLY